ncbi:MAG: 2-amino-4-hydroxy-6-hydroxymethyldihydropteridine diphosphokinase [SAR86 cluster bacterium]|uniref:2-amino-4-hydroxy-6-hydroxymethyldihydropteridine pyrophosphokinase n=1 Tax=SAR86 cluster bacterium TaxID=2030880 RepID=A0A2A4XGN1_9GAMM|nr:MAG: 2-amino-4-hydroxy-6-hydroxymethyldihydropteridine diphosphokinase [SAR86 cluster bacterium]
MSYISLKRFMNTPSNTTDSNSVRVAVSLGSNLPYLNSSPREIVLGAMESLRRISIESQASSLYLSKPIDCPPGAGDFINAAMVLRLTSKTSARGLLVVLQGIEADYGRRRGAEQNQARTLDIDIISYGNQELESIDLILPHPRARQRRFVLMPLAEIDPEMVLPGQSANIAQLLALLPRIENVQLLT